MPRTRRLRRHEPSSSSSASRGATERQARRSATRPLRTAGRARTHTTAGRRRDRSLETRQRGARSSAGTRSRAGTRGSYGVTSDVGTSRHSRCVSCSAAAIRFSSARIAIGGCQIGWPAARFTRSMRSTDSRRGGRRAAARRSLRAGPSLAGRTAVLTSSVLARRRRSLAATPTGRRSRSDTHRCHRDARRRRCDRTCGRASVGRRPLEHPAVRNQRNVAAVHDLLDIPAGRSQGHKAIECSTDRLMAGDDFAGSTTNAASGSYSDSMPWTSPSESKAANRSSTSVGVIATPSTVVCDATGN